MRSFIANTVIKWFKQLGFAGALRFKILYWAYRITGWHMRHREWDWVLDYLPPIIGNKEVRVLDVGTTSSLFIYELLRRGYNAYGLDVRPYQEKINNFIQGDIRKISFVSLSNYFHFVTCISVLEHIQEGQDIALKNMLGMLCWNGRLLLTIPTKEYGQGLPYPRGGFNYKELDDMVSQAGGKIIEYTERMGQICACIVKQNA